MPIDFSVFAAQMGMIWIGVGDPPGRTAGATTSTASAPGAALCRNHTVIDPRERNRRRVTARERLGRRVALITRRLNDGTPYEVEGVLAR
jgi:NAD(P)H dehydrogenase (quinone)